MLIFKGLENNPFVFFASGIIAETVSCVLWVPIDVVKERLQAQTFLKSYNYKGTFDAIRQIS